MIQRQIIAAIVASIPSASVAAVATSPAPTVQETFECRFPRDIKTLPAPILPREKYSEDMGGDYRKWVYQPGDQRVFGSPVSSLTFSTTVDEGNTSYYASTVMTNDNLDEVRYAVERTGEFRCILHPTSAREYTCIATHADDHRSATIAPANVDNNPTGKTSGTTFSCRINLGSSHDPGSKP